MILLIVADKLTGGAGNVAQQLASYFSKKEEYTVSLMIEVSAQPKYDLSKVQIINQKVYSDKHKNPIIKVARYLNHISQLRKTINATQADVIISFLNSISPDILFSQWFTKTPVIVSERSNPYREWETRTWLKKIQWALSYLRADRIVYQFKCFEPFFKFTFKKGNTCTIPNMVYYPKRLLPDRIEATHRPIRFTSVARLYPVKRINLMIDIMAILRDKQLAAELHIYGDGPNCDDLKHQVNDLHLEESVYFHGYITDVSASLRQNDVLLMTSEREGFPNVIVEAMNEGVPTVTFNYHDGMKEIIQDGINGVLVKKDNISAFTEALEHLLRNPQIIVDMSENGLKMCRKYDRENVMRLWQECIESVIKSK